MRDLTLRGLVLFGVAVALLTELLSLLDGLRRGPVAAAWVVMALGAAAWIYRCRPKIARVKPGKWEVAIGVVIACFVAITGLTAILSPPNSADAMAYHMPRVIYWAQAASVRFFPTPYLNQISLQPLAEYMMLHTYLLSGGDRFVNLVAFGAFLGSIIGVSAVAGALGLSTRGQAVAALFSATLPNGILQASGAKNDWLATFWMVAMVYFAARRDAPLTGLALGLALATKATAYLFAPPLLVAVWWLAWRARTAAFLAAGVLLINTPQYVRNWRLSGGPLGYDSAHGNGILRWRNEHPGWRAAASNVLRNLSEQLGDRSARWNQAVYGAVVRVHEALGIDPQDPETTWPGSRYRPPVNANHEANANNRWHLLLLAIAAVCAAATRSRLWTLYAGALAAAFLLFCFYLKWQPFLARLELPLFVLAAPLAAYLLERLRPACVAAVVCLFLVSTARLPLFQNWTRPLQGPYSLFVTARDDNYFSDMVQWNNRGSYLEAVDLVARSGCGMVGIDMSHNEVEYPLLALLRERNPKVRFVHTDVRNASARYADQSAPRPCAVICPDCLGDETKAALYAEVGRPVAVGLFLVFADTAP